MDSEVEMLNMLASRRDQNGEVTLGSADVPFFLSSAGTKWLALVRTDPVRVGLSDHGRAALGEP